MDERLKLLKTCMEKDVPMLAHLPDQAFEFYFGGAYIDASDVHDPLDGYTFKLMTMKDAVKFGGMRDGVEESPSYEYMKQLARNACVAWEKNAPEIFALKKYLADVEAERKRKADKAAKLKQYSARNIINEALAKVNDPMSLTMYLLGAKQFYDDLGKR